MEAERNMQTFRRVIDEIFNQGKFEVMHELFSNEIAEHQFGLHNNIEGLQSDVAFLRRTFPDIHLTIERLCPDGDKVWALMTARGTNSVGFMGPANGKTFEIAVFDLCRFEDGKIVEHWGSPDRFAQMAQLGLLPSQRPQPQSA